MLQQRSIMLQVLQNQDTSLFDDAIIVQISSKLIKT